MVDVGTGSATINGTVSSAPAVPSSAQTLKVAYKTGNGAWQTAFTPTAGKKAYIYGIIGVSTSVPTGMQIMLGDHSTLINYCYCAVANTPTIFFSAIPIAIVDAGSSQVCDLFAPAGGSVTIYYFEQ